VGGGLLQWILVKRIFGKTPLDNTHSSPSSTGLNGGWGFGGGGTGDGPTTAPWIPAVHEQPFTGVRHTRPEPRAMLESLMQTVVINPKSDKRPQNWQQRFTKGVLPGFFDDQKNP